MSREVGRKLKSIFWNETGQMSVFVALIFQVLFVFFAMVINIGLLVHDKINLQNAVDLGAYYAAQRQAEILNEIAHINYQMRQDWKLLVWRYRVLGSMGVTNVKNTLSSSGAVLDEPIDSDDSSARMCMTYQAWTQYQAGERKTDLCQRALGATIPAVPIVQVIAPWVPGIGAALASSQAALAMQKSNFRDAAPLNRAFAMYVIGAFKGAVAIRKQMIKTLRAKLVARDLLDLNDARVADGVEKTVRRNLTQANEQTAEVEMINGLDREPCNANGGELSMPEVLTSVVLRVVDVSVDGTPNIILHINGPIASAYDFNGLLESLRPGEPSAGSSSPYGSSLGFEKNPWCMAYVGVHATSKPRKPFSPFGEAVTLTARAFAQPFGGRIGPWYFSRWPRQSERSNGGERVDELTPARVDPGNSGPAGVKFPNFSRYPGDPYGMRSRLAIAAQREIMGGFTNSSGAVDLRWLATFISLPDSGDAASWKHEDTDRQSEGNHKRLRAAEVAAVAPDLFDITYYSIDPSYYKSYLGDVSAFGASRWQGKIQQNVFVNEPPKVMLDIGGRRGTQLESFDVKTQIQVAAEDGLAQNLRPNLYWVVQNWTHLLTSWAPHRAVNFGFPTDRFMNCDGKGEASDKVPIPGRCFAGGRTGYSVRLISRDHLLSPSWEIGGEGEAKGAILNPPGTNF
jgi:Flp pilus assembly protein TadG